MRKKNKIIIFEKTLYKMQFLTVLLFLIMISGCGQAVKEKIFEEKPENLTVSESGMQYLVSWNLPESGNVKEILIYQKKPRQRNYLLVTNLSPECTEWKVSGEPLIKNQYRIDLVSLDDLTNEGTAFGFTGKHPDIILDEVDGRKIQVYIPREYRNTDQKLKVIYMFDGQNCFDDSTSYAGEWKMDENIEKLLATETVQPVMAVGIYNSSSRADEYLPYKLQNQSGHQPLLNEHADWIVKKVVPYVENHYPAAQGTSNRMIMGSSFGGIAALWTAMNYPETFGYCAVLSPSLWVDNYAIVDEVIESDEIADIQIWTDIGTKEMADLPSLINSLESKGLVYGEDIYAMLDSGAEHKESFWAARAVYPLIMFAGEKAKKTVEMKVNLESIEAGGSVYYLLNPLLIMNNGMVISAFDHAEYTVVNEKSGIINESGVVISDGEEDIQYRVRFQNLESEGVFPAAACTDMPRYEYRPD